MMWFVYAFGSAIFFGLKQITAKKALEKEHAAEHLASVTLFVFLLSLTFLPLIKLNYGYKTWILAYIKCVVLTFSWLFAIKALRHMEISIVIPILTMSPLVLLVLSIIFLGEVATLTQYLGALLLIGGAYWLQADHNKKKLLHPLKAFKNKYMIYLLVPLVGYSICAMLDKVVLQTMNVYSFLFINYLILSIHFLIIQVYKYKGAKDIRHAFKVSSMPLILTGIFLFTTDLLYFTAVSLPNAMVSLIIPIKRASVLLVVLIGGKMFHDHNLKYRLLGCAVIIAGAILVVT